MHKTVVFDFDGVIHNYRNGWKGPNIIDDDPVPGIRDALKEIKRAGYEIVVVSTRCNYMGGIESIKNWLETFDMNHYVDEVMAEKPPALVYIDDRAICFDGHPETLLSKIDSFETWNKKTLKDITE